MCVFVCERVSCWKTSKLCVEKELVLPLFFSYFKVKKKKMHEQKNEQANQRKKKDFFFQNQDFVL